MATYVPISRAELEEWLDTLTLHTKWYLEPGRSGIYILPLSDNVAVKLSSTIGSQGEGLAVGQASMQLYLISTITKQVINKKAQGQGHFNRTTNWRITWKSGIERFRDAYMKSQGFYDALATIKDRAAYQKDILQRIEAFPGWANHDVLSDFHATAQRGGILTMKQMGFLDKILSGASKTPAPAPSPTPNTPQVDESLLNRVRALYVAAKQRNDNWLMQFAESIGHQIKGGRPLSPRQQEALNRGFTNYRVGNVNLRAILRALM